MQYRHLPDEATKYTPFCRGQLLTCYVSDHNWTTVPWRSLTFQIHFGVALCEYENEQVVKAQQERSGTGILLSAACLASQSLLAGRYRLLHCLRQCHGSTGPLFTELSLNTWAASLAAQIRGNIMPSTGLWQLTNPNNRGLIEVRSKRHRIMESYQFHFILDRQTKPLSHYANPFLYYM